MAETAQVTALLSDVEIIIRARIPDLDDKITDGDVLLDVVIMVEANVVVRLMRNPDGFIAESDGNYSYQKSGKLASGALEILDHEWSLLGVSSEVFMVNVNPRMSRAHIEEFIRQLDPMYDIPGLHARSTSLSEWNPR
jgi:hypothetical protein